MKHGGMYQDYITALRAGHNYQAWQIVQAAMSTGADVCYIYHELLQSALYEIGYLWEIGQLPVAEERRATLITQRIMAHLNQRMTTWPSLSRMVVSALRRTLVATCVSGEMHDLGLRMVADLFEIEGWTVYFLGHNIPTDDIVRMVNDYRADLLAISVTMSSNLPCAQDLIHTVRASPTGLHTKIVVGGQLFNQMPDLSKKIDADFSAADACGVIQWAMREIAKT